MGVKDTSIQLGSFSVENSESLRFGEDKRIRDMQFSDMYPRLFHIVHHKDGTVASVIGVPNPLIDFRQALIRQNLINWNEIVLRVVGMQLTLEQDPFRWDLLQTTKGVFCTLHVCDTNGYVGQVPMKTEIKVFLWFLCRQVVLMKDKLVKRK